MRRMLPYFLVLISLLSASASYADSFVITEGTFGHNLLNGRGSFDFSGPGITASGLIIDPFPTGIPLQTPISPGVSFPSFSTFVREAVGPPPSTWTVNGLPFSGRGAAYDLRFAGGPITLPSELLPSFTVEFPTTFSGTLFQCPSPAPCNSFAFPVHSLDGLMTGSITFSSGLLPSSPGSYFAQSFNATFFVPEPASALLLGAGLAGLAAWRRRGQK